MGNSFEYQGNCLISILEKLSKAKEAIPFGIYTKKGELFNAITSHKFYSCFSTPFFTIKKLDKKSGCMVLSTLIPIDMEGCPVELCTDIYSLVETRFCVTVEIKCVCGIVQIPASLINRYIPIIEPKC